MKTNGKLLAEWFWTDRWTDSRGFLLPMEPRGVYREMLTQAWRRGARLPKNHAAIRRVIGATTEEWRRSWPRVKKFWRVEGQFLVNETQRTEYQKAQAISARRAQRAKTGAAARWGQTISSKKQNG